MTVVPWYKDLRDPEFAALAGAIYLGRPDVTEVSPKVFSGNFNARKIWETTRLVQELKGQGCLRPEAIGLGIGVGIEPVQFYLTHFEVRSIGTDLYGFGWPSAPLEMLWEPWRFAPYPYDRNLHCPMQMDGMKLLMPDSSVDFIYSVSSVEHFGGAASLASHLSEATRVLKPGGWLVLSTELSLSGGAVDGWCFSREDLNAAVGQSGLLADSCETSLDPRLLAEPATLQLPDWTLAEADWHRLSVRHEGLVYTSVVIALQKPLSSGSEPIPWPSTDSSV